MPQTVGDQILQAMRGWGVRRVFAPATASTASLRVSGASWPRSCRRGAGREAGRCAASQAEVATVTPVLLALASAALFALGSALQHRSAGSASSSSKRRMAATLLRRPGWLLGAALCATAFGLHAAALARGDLTVVQPVILTGIVFAVFARAAIEGRRPGRREMLRAVVTWAGLVLVIALLITGEPRAAGRAGGRDHGGGRGRRGRPAGPAGPPRSEPPAGPRGAAGRRSGGALSV